MRTNYSDTSNRPHSALVGSPFRNVVRRFDADIIRQHHVSSVAKARSVIQDQPEPVFANILDRRGFDPNGSGRRSRSPRGDRDASAADAGGGAASSSGASPIRGGAAGAAFRARASGGADSPSGVGGFVTAGGAGGISGSSEAPKQFFSPKKKYVVKKKSATRSRSGSPDRGGGGGASLGAGSSSNVFASHKHKVHAMAERQRMRDGGGMGGGIGGRGFSHRGGGGGGGGDSSPSSHHVSVSDAGLFRARPGSGGGASSPGGGGGGISASPWSSPTGNSASRQNQNHQSSSPHHHGGGGRGSSSPPGMLPRPTFGVSQSYQRWSNTTPGFNQGEDAFGQAMRGAAAVMDDAETVEVRREIQGAIDSFLYRPVARRFAEEASKWVEEHVLPFAQTQMNSPFSGSGGGGGGRPSSAGSRSQQSGGTDSSRSQHHHQNQHDQSIAEVNIAAKRQRTLALTEEVLPLLFHHISNEIRDVVRLRIEAALLKKETRTSYL